MRPQWFSLDKIPFDQMWADDYLWFPYLQSKRPFFGYFVFKGMDTIIQSCLKADIDLSQVDIPKEPMTDAQALVQNTK
jgi:8-oxo-dGTP diphosphatase/2-hydroxy-dATP diphosphatase